MKISMVAAEAPEERGAGQLVSCTVGCPRDASASTCLRTNNYNLFCFSQH